MGVKKMDDLRDRGYYCTHCDKYIDGVSILLEYYQECNYCGIILCEECKNMKICEKCEQYFCESCGSTTNKNICKECEENNE
jgi:hypothetical protein